jgi:DNA-3-methyladenine glycosylase
MSKEIPLSFYRQTDVVQIARELLGKSLFTESREGVTGGIITETEAYAGVTDKASHAFGGRFTERTQIMYRDGGCAYVYLCYGIHSLFNIVTNCEGVPHAILIRGIFPTVGIDLMLERRKIKKAGADFCKGPGKVSKALGIHYSHTGILLSALAVNDKGMKIWLEDNDNVVKEDDILSTPRVGVDYAEEDALLPYRFELKTKTF